MVGVLPTVRYVATTMTDQRSPPHSTASGNGCETVVVAYDEDLANRIREIVQDEPGLTEKRMFGGLAFLINGNMAVSASGQGGLLLRVDPADTARLVESPAASRFEMRGREMDGWLRVDATGLTTKRRLMSWVSRGVRYARSLPAK